MKKPVVSRHLLALTIAAGALTCILPAQAQTTLVSWSFNTSGLVADGGFVSNAGVTTITSTGLNNNSGNGSPAIQFGTPGQSNSPTDFSLQAGIGKGANSNEGGYIQWAVSTAGFSDVTVAFAADNSNATSGAFKYETLYYSTDGTNFLTNTSLVYTMGQLNLTTYTADISSFTTTIEDDPNAAFRIQFTGTKTYNGTGSPNARVDNLTVTGTPLASAPEPNGVVGVFLGGGILSWFVYRRRVRV